MVSVTFKYSHFIMYRILKFQDGPSILAAPNGKLR